MKQIPFCLPHRRGSESIFEKVQSPRTLLVFPPERYEPSPFYKDRQVYSRLLSCFPAYHLSERCQPSFSSLNAPNKCGGDSLREHPTPFFAGFLIQICECVGPLLDTRAVKRPKLFFQNAPVNRPSQTEKWVAGIELAFQIGEQKGDLGFVGGAGLDGRGLQCFCGYGQVLPAIQHSKNRA